MIDSELEPEVKGLTWKERNEFKAKYRIKQSDIKNRNFLQDQLATLQDKVEAKLEKVDSKVLEIFAQSLFDLYTEVGQYETKEEQEEGDLIIMRNIPKNE